MMRLPIQRYIVVIILTFICFVARQAQSDELYEKTETKQRNVLFLLGIIAGAIS